MTMSIYSWRLFNFFCLTTSISWLLLADWSSSSGMPQAVVQLNHTYYNMRLFLNNADEKFDQFLVDMSVSPGGAVVHPLLSNLTKAAIKLSPEFIFPFYGHNMDQFYVTNHGFLSFSDQIHKSIFKTQYVAPLRVKFDASRSDHATVRYKSTHDRFTVEWRNLSVAEPYSHPEGGQFSFQTSLYPDGTIVFVYIAVPAVLTLDALYENEPVSGLSDAFLLNETVLHMYDTIFVHNVDIVNKTVVVFTPNPTCNIQTSCEACHNLNLASNFACEWCNINSVNRCSDGADRLRQHWDDNQCGIAPNSLLTRDECAVSNEIDQTPVRSGSRQPKALSANWPEQHSGGYPRGASAFAVVSTVTSALMACVLVIIGGVSLVLYGKQNPDTKVGRSVNSVVARYKLAATHGRKRFENEDEKYTDATPSISSRRESTTAIPNTRLASQLPISAGPISGSSQSQGDSRSGNNTQSMAMKMKTWTQFEGEQPTVV